MTADTLTRCRDPRPVLAGFTTAVSGWALTDTWDWEFYDRDDREFRGTVAIKRLPGRAASRSTGRILAALEGPLAELAADGWAPVEPPEISRIPVRDSHLVKIWLRQHDAAA